MHTTVYLLRPFLTLAVKKVRAWKICILARADRLCVLQRAWKIPTNRKRRPDAP